MKYITPKIPLTAIIALFILTIKTSQIFANDSGRNLQYQKRTYNLDDYTRRTDTITFVTGTNLEVPQPNELQFELKNENPFNGMKYLMFNNLLNRPKNCSFGIYHGGDRFSYYFNEDFQVMQTANKENVMCLPIPTKIIAVTNDKHIEYTLIE